MQNKHHQQIDQIMVRGLRFIAQKQLRNGGFVHYSSADSKKFSDAIIFHSVFPAALLLDSLEVVKDNPLAQKIIDKGISFLLQQKSEMWSFNYWDRTAKEFTQQPYPDDLDDTFCALIALAKHTPEVLDGESLAHIISLLTFTEVQEGGPYRTWLVPPQAQEVWKDVDVVVNSNIGYFLSLQEVELPNIITFIEESIAQEQLKSPYYPSIYAIVYAVSRFYKGNSVERLKSFLLSQQQKDGSWGDVLSTSLAVSSLMNFGYKGEIIPLAVSYLLEHEAESEQLYPLYIDPAKEGKPYYAGCKAVTKAYYLQALARYTTFSSHSGHVASPKPLLKPDKEAAKLQKIIYKEIETLQKSFPVDIQKPVKSIIAKLKKADEKTTISLLPYYFAKSLGDDSLRVSQEIFVKLGVGNVLGWATYTLYDDCLDNDADVTTLSVANVLARQLTVLFHSILQLPNAGELFDAVMNSLDAANLWETSFCRFTVSENIVLKNIPLPDYGSYEIVAQKSFGHALGPLILLQVLGYAESSKEYKHVQGFFTHYLIAKQLNDDVHDWEEDMRAGSVNPISVMLIQEWKKCNAGIKTIALEALIEQLKTLLWHEMIVDVTELVLRHVSEAEKAIQSASIVTDTIFFIELLTPLRRSMTTALQERQKVLSFLKVLEEKE